MYGCVCLSFIYGCESWLIQKAKPQRIDAFKIVMLLKILKNPLDSKEFIPVIKEINPEYSLEGLLLKLKLQIFGHLMQRANSLQKALILGKIEGKRRGGQQSIRWLDSSTDSMQMNLGKLWDTVNYRAAWHATVLLVAKSWTWLSGWTTTLWG